VWDVGSEALYWVDIRGQTVRRHDWASKKIESWRLPGLVGSLAVRKAGGLLLALQSGLVFFDPGSGKLDRLASPEAGIPDHRFNDGKYDRQGRFFAGTMNHVTRAPEGSLYRFDGRSCDVLQSGIRIPNSLCWSPDGRTMYFSDSPGRTVFVYEYDINTGMPGPRRALFSIPDPGIPDGCTVNEEGLPVVRRIRRLADTALFPRRRMPSHDRSARSATDKPHVWWAESRCSVCDDDNAKIESRRTGPATAGWGAVGA
jgi:L-arabinonolactonase